MSAALKSRSAKIEQITAKVLGGLLTFLLLIVLGSFLVNSFDVRLSAQAKTLLTPPPNPTREREHLPRDSRDGRKIAPSSKWVNKELPHTTTRSTAL